MTYCCSSPGESERWPVPIFRTADVAVKPELLPAIKASSFFVPRLPRHPYPARFTLSKGLRARIFDLIFQGVSSFAHALRYGACAFV